LRRAGFSWIRAAFTGPIVWRDRRRHYYRNRFRIAAFSGVRQFVATRAASGRGRIVLWLDATLHQVHEGVGADACVIRWHFIFAVGDRSAYGKERPSLMVETIEWREGAAVMVDQTRLPLEEVYVTCRTYQEVATAIRDMIIRGAPAIGVAAAMGVALGALHSTA